MRLYLVTQSVYPPRPHYEAYINATEAHCAARRLHVNTQLQERGDAQTALVQEIRTSRGKNYVFAVYVIIPKRQGDTKFFAFDTREAAKEMVALFKVHDAKAGFPLEKYEIRKMYAGKEVIT